MIVAVAGRFEQAAGGSRRGPIGAPDGCPADDGARAARLCDTRRPMPGKPPASLELFARARSRTAAVVVAGSTASSPRPSSRPSRDPRRRSPRRGARRRAGDGVGLCLDRSTLTAVACSPCSRPAAATCRSTRPTRRSALRVHARQTPRPRSSSDRAAPRRPVCPAACGDGPAGRATPRAAGRPRHAPPSRRGARQPRLRHLHLRFDGHAQGRDGPPRLALDNSLAGASRPILRLDPGRPRPAVRTRLASTPPCWEVLAPLRGRAPPRILAAARAGAPRAAIAATCCASREITVRRPAEPLRRCRGWIPVRGPALRRWLVARRGLPARCRRPLRLVAGSSSSTSTARPRRRSSPPSSAASALTTSRCRSGGRSPTCDVYVLDGRRSRCRSACRAAVHRRRRAWRRGYLGRRRG